MAAQVIVYHQVRVRFPYFPQEARLADWLGSGLQTLNRLVRFQWRAQDTLIFQRKNICLRNRRSGVRIPLSVLASEISVDGCAAVFQTEGEGSIPSFRSQD